jgi:hypothetical protein
MTKIPDDVRDYLARIIEEDADRNLDHLDWLKENPQEPDRDLQIAESQQAVELAGKAQLLFPPDPEEGVQAAPYPWHSMALGASFVFASHISESSVRTMVAHMNARVRRAGQKKRWSLNKASDGSLTCTRVK